MSRTRLFGRGSWPEVSRIGDILRAETVGGVLLVAAAVLALVVANSPWRDAYTALATCGSGRRRWHLDLTLTQWAADGLLAIFFFVAGLELKREFVAGDLRNPRRAALPVAAAVGGMAAARADLRRVQHRRGGTWPGGRSPPRPTSRSRWPCSRSSARTCPRPSARSCSPSPWSTTCSRSRSSRCSTPLRCACCRSRWRCSRWRCSRCWCSGGCGPGGCCCPWPPRRGCWCTSPGCTPQWRACCSDSPFR